MPLFLGKETLTRRAVLQEHASDCMLGQSSLRIGDSWHLEHGHRGGSAESQEARSLTRLLSAEAPLQRTGLAQPQHSSSTALVQDWHSLSMAEQHKHSLGTEVAQR